MICSPIALRASIATFGNRKDKKKKKSFHVPLSLFNLNTSKLLLGTSNLVKTAL
jgi:hypothetical protein